MKKKMFSVILLLFSIIILSACASNSSGNEENHDRGEKNNIVFKIVIDPGHGGTDVGSTGVSGQYEKDFTFSVSKKVGKLLEQEEQIEVFMTRADDSFISQESRYRPKFANDLNADLFISIHGNTFPDPSVSGTETLYYHKNSHHFAEILQKHVVEVTGLRDRGAKKQDLFVVRDTEMPAALIEVGYLTNPQDESKLWTDDFQNDVATAIVEGIKEYIYEK